MNKKIMFIYIILILAFILLSLDYYRSRSYYAPSSDMILSNPKQYADRTYAFSGPILNASDSDFYMSVNHRPLKVYYKGIEKPVLGQIYVLATVNEDGTINAKDVYKLSYNYIKYFISIIAFVVFLFIFFKEWKFKHWRFENA